MKTFINLLFFSFISTSVFAQPHSPLLEEYYSKRVIVTNRVFTSYHYEENVENKQIAHKSFEQYENVQRQAANFWDVKKVDSAVGPGYYVALDPYSSRNFGKENWILHIAIIKKGSRLLDIRDSAWLPENIKAELSEIGCEDNFSTFLSLRVHKNLQCREMLLNIFKKLNIDGIYYQYMSTGNSLCYFAPEAAVNIANPHIVDRNYFTAFALNQKSLLQVEYLRQYTNQFFREIAPNTEDYDPLWPDTNFAKNSLYKNYLQNQVVGCSVNDQDLSLYALFANFNHILDQDEFNEELLKSSVLLKLRFIGSNLQHYQRYKNTEFEIIKKAEEYKNWLKLQKITNSRDLFSVSMFETTLKEQLRVLGITESLNSITVQQLYWSLRPVLSAITYVRTDLLSRNRSQFIDTFEAFNIPQMIAEVYFEKVFTDFGYPPPIIMFDDPTTKDSMQSRLAIMRGMRFYIDILRQLNTQKTFSEIKP